MKHFSWQWERSFEKVSAGHKWTINALMSGKLLKITPCAMTFSAGETVQWRHGKYWSCSFSTLTPWVILHKWIFRGNKAQVNSWLYVKVHQIIVAASCGSSALLSQVLVLVQWYTFRTHSRWKAIKNWPFRNSFSLVWRYYSSHIYHRDLS